jgi:hypothetical protein
MVHDDSFGWLRAMCPTPVATSSKRYSVWANLCQGTKKEEKGGDGGNPVTYIITLEASLHKLIRTQQKLRAKKPMLIRWSACVNSLLLDLVQKKNNVAQSQCIYPSSHSSSCPMIYYRIGIYLLHSENSWWWDLGTIMLRSSSERGKNTVPALALNQLYLIDWTRWQQLLVIARILSKIKTNKCKKPCICNAIVKQLQYNSLNPQCTKLMGDS